MLLQMLLHLLNYLKVHVSKYVYFTMTKMLDARIEDPWRRLWLLARLSNW